MAQASLGIPTADQSTLGSVPSFELPGYIMFGPTNTLPYDVGAPGGGVPPADSIAGMSPGATGATGANAQAAYGQNSAASPAHQQPIFWLFVLMAVGVIILAGHAHQAVRGA
jgi:hypothetical protein